MSLHLLGNRIRQGLGANAFELAEALFLKLLGFVYLAAFGSLAPQVRGLIGSSGIVPAGEMLHAMKLQAGTDTFRELPTLFWFGISDGLLLAFSVVGCLAAILLLCGVLSRPMAAICWVLYLSLVSVGQPFTAFQWDALLLEAGFLAIFAGAPWLFLAYRFLLFRLMFESGVVKLISHDSNWRNWHALRYHFLTQPLPNPMAYYAFRLPEWLLDWMTAATLGIELIAPFLLFLPRVPRRIGAALLAFLQVLILLTGNYAFFNFLTLALCVWAFDDRDLGRFGRAIRWRALATDLRWNRFVPWGRRFSYAALAFLMLLGAVQLGEMISAQSSRPVSGILRAVAPFEIVNTYGLFAVMTTQRLEIVLEGSNDGREWKEYSFPFKPGNTHRDLPVVAPYQPRLDWQMWFAALGTYQENTWFGGLAYRILLGDKAVLGLLDTPPFATPPRYLRAQIYDYKFTTPGERRHTGAVWTRQLQGTWFGPVSLRNENSSPSSK